LPASNWICAHLEEDETGERRYEQRHHAIAFFVVQWDAGITLKLLVILISAFLITLGLVELLIRPFKPMRMLFGMKARRRKEVTDKPSLA
jgi:hypothetical protein